MLAAFLTPEVIHMIVGLIVGAIAHRYGLIPGLSAPTPPGSSVTPAVPVAPVAVGTPIVPSLPQDLIDLLALLHGQQQAQQKTAGATGLLQKLAADAKQILTPAA